MAAILTLEEVREALASRPSAQDVIADPTSVELDEQSSLSALEVFMQCRTDDVLEKYANNESVIPLNFASNRDAQAHLMRVKTQYLIDNRTNENAPLPSAITKIKDAVDVFCESRLAATILMFGGPSSATLAVYDYDRKLYTTDSKMLAKWVVTLMGSVSESVLRSFTLTIEAQPERLAAFNPPARWQVPVKNGVFDLLSKQLIAQTPLITTTTRIETNYVANAIEPALPGGVTFDKLCADLANYDPRRVVLVKQIVSTVLLGYSPTAAVFIMLGRGGDGKGIFMQLMSNIIGPESVAALTFTDMSSESKFLEAAQARLAVGMDNDENLKIEQSHLLKSASSREPMAFDRKYLTSVTLKFDATIVQLCNSMPRFVETGTSIRRRVVVLSAENSHYDSGSDIVSLSKTITNKAWHEYILSSVLDSDTHWVGYENVDYGVLDRSLSAENAVGTFVHELHAQGVLGEHTPVLPKTHLYGVYCDWMAKNYSNSKVHSSRTFNDRVKIELSSFGYRSPDVDESSKLSTIQSVYGIDLQTMFGHLSGGSSATETLESDALTQVFVYDKDSVRPLPGQNGCRRVDVGEYMAIWDDVVEDIMVRPWLYAEALPSLQTIPVQEAAVANALVDAPTLVAPVNIGAVRSIIDPRVKIAIDEAEQITEAPATRGDIAERAPLDIDALTELVENADNLPPHELLRIASKLDAFESTLFARANGDVIVRLRDARTMSIADRLRVIADVERSMR